MAIKRSNSIPSTSSPTMTAIVVIAATLFLVLSVVSALGFMCERTQAANKCPGIGSAAPLSLTVLGACTAAIVVAESNGLFGSSRAYESCTADAVYSIVSGEFGWFRYPGTPPPPRPPPATSRPTPTSPPLPAATSCQLTGDTSLDAAQCASPLVCLPLSGNVDGPLVEGICASVCAGACNCAVGNIAEQEHSPLVSNGRCDAFETWSLGECSAASLHHDADVQQASSLALSVLSLVLVGLQLWLFRRRRGE